MIYLVSFPRSGRAWTMTIVEALRMALKQKIRHKHSHDKASMHTFHQYRSDKSWLTPYRTILTIRNPRDVVVSYYMILKHRTQRPSVVNMDLLRWTQSKEGLPFVVRFLNDWGAAIEQKVVPRLMLIRYENLLSEPRTEIVWLAIGLGIKPEQLTPKVIQSVIDDTTLDRIRTKFSHSNGGENDIKLDPRGYSARRGESNVWHEYYTDIGIRWTNEYVDENLEYFREFYA